MMRDHIDQNLRCGADRLPLLLSLVDQAVENDKRANSTVDPELKRMFRQIAAQYRDLALQIENPGQWRTKLIASDNKAKQK
jgi:hypothetical protein